LPSTPAPPLDGKRSLAGVLHRSCFNP
jgi:hypothetical protein